MPNIFFEREGIFMFGILRYEKVKMPGIASIEQEHKREREKLPWQHIQDDMLQKNVTIKDCDDFKQAALNLCEERGAKVKKDSILLLDGVVTFSPEFCPNLCVWMHLTHDLESEYFGFDNPTPTDAQQQHMEWLNNYDEKKINEEWKKVFTYFDKSIDFIKKTQGEVIYLNVHMDEDTPHLHYVTVPLVEKDKKIKDENGTWTTQKGWSLSAKDIVGNKSKMSACQDAFFEEVAKPFGLSRGERKTVTTQHFTAAQKAMDEMKNSSSYYHKVISDLKQTISRLRKEKKDLKKQYEDLSIDYDELRENYDDLSMKVKNLIETYAVAKDDVSKLEKAKISIMQQIHDLTEEELLFIQNQPLDNLMQIYDDTCL